MRKETKAERLAWSEYFGDKVEQPSKYKNERAGKYASRHEAEVAGDLSALECAGKIKELREHVRIVLVPKNGKLRAITYIADFQYLDLDGKLHTLDAKGGCTAKLPVYRLKKRLLKFMHDLDIEEV